MNKEMILAILVAYKAWDTAETIEEARAKRSKLAMSFFSIAVVIVNEHENEVE